MSEDAAIAEEQGNAAFFLAPRRRGKLIAGIASVALVVVATFIYLTMQGPNNRSIALEMAEDAVSEFSGQTLGPQDVKRHARRLSEALGLAPEEEAIKAAVETLKSQLHAQLVNALALDQLEDTEAVLNEATSVWPDEEAFKGYGELAIQLKQRREELQLREELLTKLSEAQARLEGGSATSDAIRNTLGLVEELLDQESTLKTDAKINSNLRELLTVGARAATKEDEVRGASQLLDASRDLWRDDAGLRMLDADLKSRLGEIDRMNEIGQLIDLGHQRLSEDLLTTPAGASARDAFNAILMMDPGNAQALDGMEKIANRYVDLIGAALNANSLTSAKQHLSSLEKLDAGHVAIEPLQERLGDKERLLELERLNAERSASAPGNMRGEATATQPPPDAVPADDEGTLWLKVRDFCATLDQYIIKYPAGRYVEEAWLRKSECLKQ
ncbi:MAG: hypothetical protein OXJ53_09670 [Gammaproteobacteria bacterium]|nr:hypothetical protein [Gammaproteobacteria bacterium]MDE0273477.1 hypothetical protein [Gammaproteobacteria bacterium]